MYEHIDLPPTRKQLDYARAIARRLDIAIPHAHLKTRRSLSRWIDDNKLDPGSGVTSRQVAYAEKIARMKRRAIPEACFRDAGLMSSWISSNR